MNLKLFTRQMKGQGAFGTNNMIGLVIGIVVVALFVGALLPGALAALETGGENLTGNNAIVFAFIGTVAVIAVLLGFLRMADVI